MEFLYDDDKDKTQFVSFPLLNDTKTFEHIERNNLNKAHFGERTF